MNRIALAFHRRLDTGRVLEVICKETRELFHVDIATIFLREDGGYVQHAACGMEVGRSRIERSEAALPESELVDQGEAFFINDFEDHPISRMEIVRRYMGRRPARSMMVIPILDNDRVLGTLTLADRRDPKRFTARDIDKGKLLGQQAAQAIVNARLYERVDQSKRIIRQQDRFRILGELAGVVAHEIKNALVPLRTLVDLLPRRYDDADFREWYAKTVCQEVERMHGLVLQLSRFRGAENRVVESNDSVALLSSVVELIRPEAMGRQIEIDLEAESNLPNIDVVANEIRQVLLNLILNAVQAVDEKGTVRVGVRRGDDGSGILFWVSDTGPGIAPENVEKIFDPLYTSKKDGSGLGLAVARDLVQAHGGTIRVESQPGKGATFVVLFPGVAGRAESPIVIR
jgi:signal transduction histidine kinase